jgi:hypothetical protein
LTVKGVNSYRDDVGAINVIYKNLQEDRDAADISSILRELHAVIEPAIEVKGEAPPDGRIYDISAIDFDLCVPKTSSALIRGGNRLTLAHHDRVGLLYLVGLERPVQVEEPA